jgi:3-isopropylmalate dehydratase small subunit
MTKTDKNVSDIDGVGTSLIGGRMMVASRYAECLHRLARQAGRLDLVELSEKLTEVANLIQEMADEIEVDSRGAILLRKAGRLIGTVEAAVDHAARRATLH